MPKWLWVGLLGVVLLVPGALFWIDTWISNPLRLADERAAFRRLATVPLSQAWADRGVLMTAVIPDDPSWRHIRRKWGDPGYFIGAVSPGRRHDLYCFTDLDVRVEATIGNHPLDLETADPPYSYAVDCRTAGLLFRAPAGAVVQIRVVAARKPQQTADLVVVPHWTGETKDRLVGLDLQEDLQAITTKLSIAGIIAIAIAAVLFSRRPRRPAR